MPRIHQAHTRPRSTAYGLDSAEPDDWRRLAACRDHDPELWFPTAAGHAAAAQSQEAIAVCYRCPVREQCLDWALRHGEEYGVWGATTEDERRAIRRQVRAAGTVAP